MNKLTLIFLIMCCVTWAFGCGGDNDDDTGGDSDMDTDADTDTDADSDSDGDTDTDSDSDTDTDTDTDSDSDTDTDADTDVDSDTDSDTDSNTDALGDDCHVEFTGPNGGNGVEVQGVCAASDQECISGFSSFEPAGSCQQELTCCINDDQCEAEFASGQCAATIEECDGEPPGGAPSWPQVGCPAETPYCCFAAREKRP